MQKVAILASCLLLSFALSVFSLGGAEKGVSSTQAEIEYGRDWARWRGPDGNGKIPYADWNPMALTEEPEVLWEIKIGNGYSSIAVKNGLLYTMGNANKEDTVYCLDAETGDEVWTYSYSAFAGEYPGPRATPTVDDGRLYTISRYGNLYCFDAANGKVVWNVDIRKDFGCGTPSWGFTGSPVVVDNLLILNAGKAGLALRKKNGKEVWSSESGTTGGYATPVIFEHEGELYAAIFGQKALYLINVRSGDQLASYEWITSNYVNAADPLVIGKRFFISSNYGKGSAMLELKGNRLESIWQIKDMESHFSSPVLINGYIYGHDGDVNNAPSGDLVCVDEQTGDIQWEQNLGVVSLIAIGDTLIIMDGTGSIIMAEATPTAYSEIASSLVLTFGAYTPKSWTPPVFANGRIYCRNMVGQLMAIDVSS